MFLAGNILRDETAAALGVGHLTKDAAAGAGDAFDGRQRSVWVDGNLHGWHADLIAILGGDLAVSGQFCDH